MKKILIIVPCMVVAVALHAAPVYLDSTFGPNKNGTIVSAFGNDDEAMDVSVNADGTILVAGNSLINQVYNVISTRYLTSGLVDTTFRNQGVSQCTALNGLTVNSMLNFGSEYLVMGSVMMDVNPYVGGGRFFSNGTIDPSFGSAGIMYNPAYGITENAALQNNQIIALVNAGIIGNEQLAMYVIRLNSDASFDYSFGGQGTGIRKIPILNVSSIYGHSLYVGATGILVSGYINQYGGEKAFVAKFTSNGLVDTTFGNGAGYVLTALPSGFEAHTHFMGLQSTGNIVVAGSNGCQFAVLRYTSSGVLDTSFGTQGITITSIGNCAHGYAGTILSDDRIVVAGLSDDAMAIAVYTANGALDPTFGNGGIATAAIGDNSIVQAVAVQSDGKIIAVGSAENRWAVARFLANNNNFVSIASPANGATITSSNFGINGVASQAAMPVEVLVDGSALSTVTTDNFGNWNVGTTQLIANGAHTVLAQLMNGASVLASGSSSITVAASTDAIAIISPSSGGTVITQTPTFSGTSTEPNATVQISVDGALMNSTTTNGLGNWNLTSTPLSNGNHTVAVQLMNGQTVRASATQNFTVNVAPSITFSSPVIDSTITSSTTSIKGTCSEPNITVHVVVDGVAFKKVTTSAMGAWDAGTSSALANGDHSIVAFGTVGSTQISANCYFTVNV